MSFFWPSFPSPPRYRKRYPAFEKNATSLALTGIENDTPHTSGHSLHNHRYRKRYPRFNACLHCLTGIENNTYLLGRVSLSVIECHSLPFIVILCHFVTLSLVQNLHFGRKYAKNGFGKGFALRKSENETEQNLTNK